MYRMVIWMHSHMFLLAVPSSKVPDLRWRRRGEHHIMTSFFRLSQRVLRWISPLLLLLHPKLCVIWFMVPGVRDGKRGDFGCMCRLREKECKEVLLLESRRQSCHNWNWWSVPSSLLSLSTSYFSFRAKLSKVPPSWQLSKLELFEAFSLKTKHWV